MAKTKLVENERDLELLEDVLKWKGNGKKA
jgi:hypothetical protein